MSNSREEEEEEGEKNPVTVGKMSPFLTPRRGRRRGRRVEKHNWNHLSLEEEEEERRERKKDADAAAAASAAAAAFYTVGQGFPT